MTRLLRIVARRPEPLAEVAEASAEDVDLAVKAARAAGRESADGLGLLIYQARRALTLWLGEEVPIEPLAAAVGWPR